VQKDNAAAQVEVGHAFHEGLGTLRNIAQAVTWYRLAAIQGNATAQFTLGSIYSTGEDDMQDFTEAVHW
jgi:TPR repeat protein